MPPVQPMTACLSAPLESAQLSIVKCTGNAAPACSYQRCRNCCVARGAGRLGLNPCSHSLHRIHNGNASYFQGNPAPLTDAGIHELPIASPTSGDLTRPASVAWIEYCGVGWEDHNAVLKADAEARMLTEGFTINVFIWTEECSEPAAYMRVIRHGRYWSLGGDTTLWEQLTPPAPQGKILVYDTVNDLWKSVSIHRKLKFNQVGCSVYIKYPGIRRTPLQIIIMERIYKPLKEVSFEETILAHFAPV